MYQKIVTFR